MPHYPTWISAALKDLLTLVQLIAVIAAGLWAYMKFVKGRMFSPRLEVSVAGTTVLHEDRTSLIVLLKVKNVGLSRVDVRQEGTALRVLSADEATPSAIVTPNWTHLGTFSVFERHGWVEPGETIDENKLLILPGASPRNYLFELHVGADKLVWTAATVVAATDPANVRQDIAGVPS